MLGKPSGSNAARRAGQRRLFHSTLELEHAVQAMGRRAGGGLARLGRRLVRYRRRRAFRHARGKRFLAVFSNSRRIAGRPLSLRPRPHPLSACRRGDGQRRAGRGEKTGCRDRRDQGSGHSLPSVRLRMWHVPTPMTKSLLGLACGTKRRGGRQRSYTTCSQARDHSAACGLSGTGMRIHIAAMVKPTVRWTTPQRMDVIATPARSGKNATARPIASATF